MARTSPTVFIVDDAPEIRRSVSRMLSTAGHYVRPFESAEQFLEAHDKDNAGCVLLDYFLPGLSGLELQRALIDSGCTLPVVFLTGAADVQISVDAMKGGAVDFLTKPIDPTLLFSAVEQALQRDAAQRRIGAIRNVIQQRLRTLTPRERQVMIEVVRGRLNKQIAADLGTGEKTVKAHRARVMNKMDARSVAQLVQLGGRVGISIEPILDNRRAAFDWVQARRPEFECA